MKIRQKTNPKKRAILFAASVLISGLQVGPALAAPAQSGGGLLAQVQQTLQSATSLQGEFEETDSYPTNYKDLAQRGDFVLARPDRLRIDIHRFRRVSAADAWVRSGNDAVWDSDGKAAWYAFLHPSSTQVRRQEASPAVYQEALRGLPPLGGFFAPDGGIAAQASGDAVLLPAGTWEGQSYQLVQYPVASARSGAETTAVAYVGQDLLIHRLIYTTQTDAGTVTKEWDLRHLKISQPEPDTAFAYTPPADATALDRSPRASLLAAGSVAPDFTVTDASGKPVKLSDYKGKTVLLDFWATWCWPCNQSLPHTEKLAEEYRDKNVVVLAVAIWDSKSGFDAWIHKHHYPNINFAIDPRPQGQDAASALYQVTATPTAYVIDADGKIVRSIAGFAGPSQELESALQAARAPKTARESTPIPQAAG